jgi:endoglycosylceramidase
MRRRLRGLTCALLVAGLGCAAAGWAGDGRATPSAGRHATSSPVSHVRQWIVDGRGRVLIDHGFNVVSKLAPYDPAADGFGADDARFLRRHGFTVVRLGVLPVAVEPAPGHFDDGYLDRIHDTVRLLARHGIRTLLDFHQDLYSERYTGEGLPDWMALDDGLPAQPQAGFPGSYFAMPALWRAFDNLWANTAGPGGIGLRDRYAAMWAHVAARFKGDPAVLGYDLFNEPYPGSDYLTCFPPQGCPADDEQKLAPFMRAAIDAVHAVDPGHLTFYEPWLMFDYGAPTALGDFADDMSGMSFHDYCLATVGVPETPPTRTVCNGLVEERVMTHALEQAQVSGDALLLSEFGATDNQVELREILDLAADNGIPWTEWAYCACGDPTGNGEAEALVHDPAQPPAGDNVSTDVLDVLDEPHPLAVAGTPGSYHFDPDSRRFRFAYDTRSVAGHTFGRAARTEIWIGRLHYSHGYRVTVDGGRVVSHRNADTLVIKADRGAARVALLVTPGRP